MIQTVNTAKLFSLLFIILLSSSCDEEGGLLIEPDISSSEIVLLSPTNGAQVSTNTLSFFWEPVSDAYTYEIQVATPDFENAVQFLLNREDSTTTAELELPIGEYQWRVRAKNGSYTTAYSTASFSVEEVEDFPNNTVVLESPVDNLITNSADQNLQWQAIDGATLYRIQLEMDGTIYDELNTTGTGQTVNFQEGENLWRVRAENGIQNTLYFSRNILVDLTPPNQPRNTCLHHLNSQRSQ